MFLSLIDEYENYYVKKEVHLFKDERCSFLIPVFVINVVITQGEAHKNDILCKITLQYLESLDLFNDFSLQWANF